MKQVEAKLLVEPMRINEKGVEEDGRIVKWARFDIADTGYHFSWDINNDKLVHITIMSPIPERLK
ncbi:MAG: hypothetical protein JW927_07760 [Deltaproteobacteria bacterium]|nr:hypothetical protein [Deltaproteobacteria bacterium]